MHRFRRLVAGVSFLIMLAAFPAAVFADTSFVQLLTQLEQQYQLPTGILWKVALAENGGKSTGCASTSSACGMFQFTTSTWLADTKALFGQPLDLNLRNSPDLSAKAAAYELDVIKTQVGPTITQAKVDLSAGLYLGYFLGSGGAKILLNAYMQNQGQSACSILPKQCAANQSVMASRSVSQLINWASQKMSVSGVPNVPGNFQCADGTSYANSYCDVTANSFLPANTVIPPNPYGSSATVFPPVTSTPVSPAPTPLPTQPVTQSTNPGSACTAQYSCSNGTVYYESSSCTQSVFQMCAYGCLGTICAPTPSASSSPQMPGSTSSSTSSSSNGTNSVFTLFDGTSNPVFSATNALNATNSLLTDAINTLLGGNPVQATGTATVSMTDEENSTFPLSTFNSGSFGGTYAVNSSPFSELLDGLKSVLNGLLSYLQSL